MFLVSMVIDDLDGVCRFVLPGEANAPLIVDADAKLTRALSFQGFQNHAFREYNVKRYSCKRLHDNLHWRSFGE